MRHTSDPITVLHVDDDPEVADLAATFLERADDRLAVETLTDAAVALDRIDAGGVDCVVSDYEMPGRTGIEFLEAVRAEHPDLPFILFTGKGSEEVASDAISAGVTDYLQKQSGSAQYELLANRIRRAVDQRRSEQYARQKDRQYRELFDQAPIMYVLVRDERGWPIIEDCNDRFLRKLGYDRGAVVGRPTTDFFAEESATDVYEGGAYERALRGEFDLEERTLLTKDGDRIETLLRATPRLDAHGEVTGVQTLYLDVTDRAGRDRELERYETIIEASGDPVYTVDADGRLTFVNDAFCDLVGHPASALLGEHVSVVMDEADIERGEALIRDLLETDADRGTFEMDLIAADGERIPCETHVALLPFDEDDGEGFRGTTGVHRVITDRKRRENALRALHEATGDLMRARDEEAVAERAVEMASTVLDLPVCTLWVYDAAADALRPAATSERGRKLLGEAPTYTGGESLSWRAFRDGEVRVYDDLREEPDRLNPETSIRSELILPLGERGVMNFGSTDVDAFDDLDVSLARILANTVEAALTRTARDRKLKRIQERTETLMTTTDVEETARVAVETARDVLGAELSGFHRLSDDGRRLEPIVVTERVRECIGEAPTYDRDAGDDPVSAFVWDAYERGDPVVIEDASDHERLEGSVARSGLIYPIADAGVFVVSATDPGAFDEVNATLVEILGSALTTALNRVERESLLRARQDTLERQNERLEAFASVVSHDLRNPLTVAQGRVELAREECDSDHLGDAASAVDRSLALIEDLLALAREGDAASDLRDVSLPALAEGCWTHVETGDARLVVDTERTIRADRNRLSQVLENLFRNAVEHGAGGATRPDDDAGGEGRDAASDGEPTVTVTVGDLADGSGFYVADDGRGFQTDDPETAFETGYSTHPEGTGFGLAIVTEIARAHGWTVDVTESAAGGARVEIRGVETATAGE